MKARAITTLALSLLVIIAISVTGTTIWDARRQAIESQRQGQARRLLEKIAVIHQRLSQASLEFAIARTEALSVTTQNSLDTRETVNSAYQTLLRAANNAAFSATRLDDFDSSSAGTLIAAEHRLLQQSRQRIRTDYARVVAVLNDEEQTAERRALDSEAIFQEIRRASQQDGQVVMSARKKFVAEFKLDNPSR